MTDDTGDDLHRLVLRDLLAEIARRQSTAEMSYKSLSRKARREVLLAEYVCRTKDCLLLHVWNTTEGLCYYRPRFRLSPEATEAGSVESARQSRTSDGYRKWLPRWGSLNDLLAFCDDDPYLGADVNCDHFRGIITGRRLAFDIEGVTPGNPAGTIKLPDVDTPGSGSSKCSTVLTGNVVSAKGTPGRGTPKPSFPLAAESAKAFPHAQKHTSSQSSRAATP